VHTFERLWTVDFMEEFELEKERLEVGAGETPLDAANAAG
jgi:hypothetical protein